VRSAGLPLHLGPQRLQRGLLAEGLRRGHGIRIVGGRLRGRGRPGDRGEGRPADQGRGQARERAGEGPRAFVVERGAQRGGRQSGGGGGRADSQGGPPSVAPPPRSALKSVSASATSDKVFGCELC